MAAPSLPRHIQAMLSPDAYPHPVDGVELRQTHISYLFFAGDFVYKVKKPLDLGFLDFKALEQRHHFCQEEVRLNRRLCSETYLGVVPIVLADGGAKVDGEGAAVDYAVKMRRLPEEGMMTRLLERDAVTPERLAQLAHRVADFHAESERSDEIDRFGGLETAMQNWRENFEQTETYIGRTISRRQFEEIQSYVGRVAEQDADLFDLRVREGRARDCHGDLRADAVCFKDEGVCIYDCIEFNERFRYSDVAADIAFLAMDLEYQGRRDLSDELLGRYLAATLDATLPLVLPFYKCYRAYVRGKVDGFQLDQPEVDERQKAQVIEGARRYFELAHAYATQSTPPALIITVGVTGSGKSRLADALAARLGALILPSDVVRKRLQGIDPTERRIEPIDSGIYQPEVTNRTYQALLDEARPWLERGKLVILDASYLQRAQREAALRLAQETGARLLALECRADEALVRERLSARQGKERIVSDGRWEVYQAQQERREPVDELPAGSHLVVETAGPLREQIDAVVAHLELVAGRAEQADKTQPKRNVVGGERTLGLRYHAGMEHQANVRRSSSGVVVRPASEADLQRINEIYNHYVLTSPATFDIEPITDQQRLAWFARFETGGRHRLFVAEEGGTVLGYADSHEFRDRRAYDTTVETTVYCAPEATGRGVGRLLYGALFDALRGEELRVAIAGMTLPNAASGTLHERFGFTLVGVMHDVGRKFDRYWDVAWYEKRLAD